DPEVLSSCLETRAAAPVAGAAGRSGEELEVRGGRPRRARAMGRLHGRLRAGPVENEHPACAVVRRSSGPQVVHPADGCGAGRRRAGEPRSEVPETLQSAGRGAWRSPQAARVGVLIRTNANARLRDALAHFNRTTAVVIAFRSLPAAAAFCGLCVSMLACQTNGRTSRSPNAGAARDVDAAPYQAEVEEGLGAAVAILIDTSGSMRDNAPGDTRPKYVVAEEALEAMLDATDAFVARRPDFPI